MIMSFAVPLGVGDTSLGDYFDLRWPEDMATSEIAARLDEQMAEGCISCKCPQGRGWKSW